MIERLRTAGRMLTAPARQLPAFLIIGAQKAGTTSLFEHLVDHPDVVPPRRKELHFFDRPASPWRPPYRSHFPIRRPGAVTGEATPYLLFHPTAAERVATTLPDVVVVAVLRDPVQRAWSHYRMERRLEEARPFAEAVFDTVQVDEQDRRLRAGDPGPFFEHQYRSYLRRGEYADQLSRWLDRVDPTSVLVLDFADFSADPHRTTDLVLERLGLSPLPADAPLRASNVGDDEPIDPAVAAQLRDHYRPHDEALQALLGRRFSWMTH